MDICESYGIELFLQQNTYTQLYNKFRHNFCIEVDNDKYPLHPTTPKHKIDLCFVSIHPIIF